MIFPMCYNYNYTDHKFNSLNDKMINILGEIGKYAFNIELMQYFCAIQVPWL